MTRKGGWVCLVALALVASAVGWRGLTHEEIGLARTDEPTAPDSRTAAGRGLKAVQEPKREELRYNGRGFDEWATELLTELLPERRVKALTALEAFARNGYGAEAARAIVAMMRGYDVAWLLEDSRDRHLRPDIFNGAIDVLNAAGRDGEPELLPAVTGSDPFRKYFVLLWFKDLDSEGVVQRSPEWISKLLHDKDRDVRQAAVSLFAKKNAKFSAVEAALVKAMKEGDLALREAILDEHNPWGGERLALGVRLAGLQAPESSIRCKAISTISLSREDGVGLPLLRLLKDANAEVRQAVLRELDRAADTADTAPSLPAGLVAGTAEENATPQTPRQRLSKLMPGVEMLEKQLSEMAEKDTDPEVRKRAAGLLKRLSDKQAEQPKR
jgi:hypothetical protein